VGQGDELGGLVRQLTDIDLELGHGLRYAVGAAGASHPRVTPPTREHA
jgi:hypothetical protein